MRFFLTIIFYIFLVLSLNSNCSMNKSKKTTKPATDNDKLPTTSTPINTYTPPIIKIQVVGIDGNILYVTLNKQSQWIFQPIIISGSGNPIITRIDVPNPPPSMLINTSQNSVTFTPKSKSELTGIINVYAKDTNCPSNIPNCEKMETFYWNNQQNINNNPIQWVTNSQNIMLQILLPLIQKYLEETSAANTQIQDLINELLKIFQTQQQGINNINLYNTNFLNTNTTNTSFN